MVEVVFVTKSGVLHEKFAALDEVAERVKTITDLLAYRCYQVYGNNRKKKKEPIKR